MRELLWRIPIAPQGEYFATHDVICVSYRPDTPQTLAASHCPFLRVSGLTRTNCFILPNALVAHRRERSFPSNLETWCLARDSLSLGKRCQPVRKQHRLFIQAAERKMSSSERACTP